MNIPKKIKLAGFDIETVFAEVYNDMGDGTTCRCAGKADFQEQTIYIDDKILTQQAACQAYLHEQIHWILYVMNEHELRCNEKFVDTFAHLLYQARISEEF